MPLRLAVPGALLALVVAAAARGTAPPVAAAGPGAVPVLRAAEFAHHVERFNRMAPEHVVNHVPDAQAWEWMARNVPLFEAPDERFEETYYYRWWTFRKHIKRTPRGFILTEFLRDVGHAAEHNAISCALGHHIYEGRWLWNRRYLDDYVSFWLRSPEGSGLHPRLHQFSGWVADAVYGKWLVQQDTDFLLGQLDALILDYRTWERERRLPTGLFWQYDVADGMEESISGSRTAKHARPTINSYMFGNASALARIARLAGRDGVERQFEAEAGRLRSLVEAHLWDADARFFKPLLETGTLAGVRELIGFTPWYFHLPTAGRGYEVAWRQLNDPEGFQAPYGPTTAERRHPGFTIAYEGDDCQWNGPSWPFATTVTLKALANLLHDHDQSLVTRDQYFALLKTYTGSQRRRTSDGRIIPWIDENLHPFTGEWLARAIKVRKGRFNGRGDHYNHSGYADLVITGLVGLRPRPDDIVEVDPLLPSDAWNWFALDNLPYHGQRLTIVWDRTGEKYGLGPGLRVLASGIEIARSRTLSRVTGRLPSAPRRPRHP